MVGKLRAWAWHPAAPFVAVELFILTNLSFLAVDIYFAHSVNSFERWEEWIPFYFSLLSPVVLVAAIGLQWRAGWRLAGRALGAAVGFGAVAVGVAGLIYHLESQFFEQWTLKSLVYTAPFVAPLAYTGVGLLILLNRSREGYGTLDWARWVVLLAWGGFIGNFILSLADHAQNGFFLWEEWIAVVAAAIAVGVLVPPMAMEVGRGYVAFAAAVMLTQMGVGLLGFYFHGAANLHAPGESLWDRFVWGAPIFAPLLFANLALLALLGLWEHARHVGSPAPAADAAHVTALAPPEGGG